MSLNTFSKIFYPSLIFTQTRMTPIKRRHLPCKLTFSWIVIFVLKQNTFRFYFIVGILHMQCFCTDNFLLKMVGLNRNILTSNFSRLLLTMSMHSHMTILSSHYELLCHLIFAWLVIHPHVKTKYIYELLLALVLK